ncbi:MAG: hypothetical protein KGL62_11805 [Bradyrhizobium sp.]|uniref:hypothetical protein n=1 Tax=Bradyrhizobium sp. TaxID=376 RepID=UPI0023918CE6|nr:hypothetical protein [Bradyrhizobium sp.]MDE2603037.1 hypothetical protein [Bradyrhizobium sp.]
MQVRILLGSPLRSGFFLDVRRSGSYRRLPQPFPYYFNELRAALQVLDALFLPVRKIGRSPAGSKASAGVRKFDHASVRADGTEKGQKVSVNLAVLDREKLASIFPMTYHCWLPQK